MAHIKVPEGVPGIRSLVAFRPETGKPLYELAEVLLRNESPLSPAERELIAAYVSSLNQCQFCTLSHAAAARELYESDGKIVDVTLKNINNASIGPKLNSLLQIAGKVQQNGKEVTKQDVEEARKHGACDRDIHDTVLIAATFCMFNRYVDGLSSWAPTDLQVYREMGKRMAKHGYQFTKEN
ncbi:MULTISPECIES: carboxymuconolactone decarboxylase family protein [unclassified Arenibacter]|uniref:carboxymuconolactone decarboxylase family protein n=1 Tax=unclassified Arenibacter TaxID=2615047 RepID=UPI000E355CAE|nr:MULTISPECIES: peroxidase-related enzyme [unclassified Arenibacter]MCM4165393.1 carboxymuconolactone decarboxylase [Arenibacter sp. A80]RFT54870.1 carboxymuconolactone decarboxylase [Arenibacter sp. P308M17]